MLGSNKEYWPCVIEVDVVKVRVDVTVVAIPKQIYCKDEPVFSGFPPSLNITKSAATL